MRHFPVFLDLRGRRALVVGGGAVALRKAEPLREAGASVTVAEHFRAEDLDGCALAIGADAAEADLQALSAEAMRRGIPVNVVDRPALCSFIMGALIDRDPITIAVSSSGTAPVLARLLRARIEAAVPPAFGRLAGLAETMREAIRRRLPDVAERRRVLEQVFTGSVADLVFAGEEAAAAVLFERSIEAGGRTPGRAFLIDGGVTEPDLLTLRAHRVLGEADTIVHDADASTAVLAMARRDAARVVAGSAMVAALVRQGQRVVHLTRDARADTALADADVAFEVVPTGR